MDLKDKIVGLAMACLIALIGWQLHQTWSLKEEVFKLQQGQIVLSKQIKHNTNIVKQKLKQLKKKQNYKNIEKQIKKNNKNNINNNLDTLIKSSCLSEEKKIIKNTPITINSKCLIKK